MTTLVDAPIRVDGVQLLGEMGGSGYRTPPALVRRADGQVLQLSPLLYLVLNAVDGERSCAGIAALVGPALGRSVTEADVRTLVNRHLRPLGLVRPVDGSEPALRRSNPLLRIRPRIVVTNPRTTRLLTDPFRLLFRPLMVTAVLVGFFLVVAWVFFDRGLGASAYDAFQRPQLLLLVFVVGVLAGGFHEFGHAAAARYGGAQPGVMGAGLYLVWPAFYTDVTDSYRLGRWGRVRTDLGGLYFNALVVVLTFVCWWATGWEALLLLVAIQVLQMVHQLLPLLRFDGYHLLADLTGVPDLYQRIKPTLAGILPHHWGRPENRVLKPWARGAITLWVLVTVPMLVVMLAGVVLAVPRLLGSAGSAIDAAATALVDALGDGSPVDVAGHAVQVLGVALPVLGCAMILSRMGLRLLRGLSRWSQGSAPKRVVAALVTATLLTGVSWAWWPHPGSYRPIQPGEHGIFTTVLQEPQDETAADGPRRAAALSSGPELLPAGTVAQRRLASGQPLLAAFQQGQPLPTRDDPVLAMVLVPRGSPQPPATTSGDADADGTWVFPFDKPLPPEEGDNQALAVATEDGSMSYDVAFALVWADSDEVLDVNEAHAYASCSDCVAVAVAFQVVLVMHDAQVVAPQNLAVSANYDCYRCITAAIASQLVLSLSGEPGEDQLRALGEVWNQLIAFAQTITAYSLSDIAAELENVKAEIVAVLATAPTVSTEATASATDAPAPTSDVDDPLSATTTSPSPEQEGTFVSPSPSDSTTSSPSPSPSGTTSPSPSPSPSPSASDTTTEEATSPTATPSP